MGVRNLESGALFTHQADAGFIPKTPEGLGNTGVKLRITLGQEKGEAAK